jgi:hypothetical protein
MGIFLLVVDVELVLVVLFSDSFSGSEGLTDLGLVLSVVLASKVKLPADGDEGREDSCSGVWSTPARKKHCC